MRNPRLTVTHADATKARLFRVAETVPGAWVGLKIAGLLLVIEGQRPGWICDVLGVTRMSVSRWIHAVNRDGLAALIPKPRPGRPTRLAPKVQQALATHLAKPPGEFGLHRAQWDGPTVVVHLRRQFGVKLAVRQAQRWMHHLGYRLKQASYTYLQARGEQATRFQRALKKT